MNEQQPQFLWKGHRLFAIDGTRVQLPYSEELREHFKCPENQTGTSHYPQAILSKLFCILTDVVYDFELAPYDASERELAISHLAHLKAGDIVIVDRGYPSYEMFWECLQRHIDFIMRVPLSRWAVVKQFLKSGKREQIITLTMNQKLKKQYRDDTTVPKTLTLRLIRITLITGETEVLITSLLDTDNYPYEDFPILYYWRWPIEEANRSAKHHQCLENFHAKDRNGILQELNAHYLLMAMTRLYMLQAEVKTPERIYGLSYKSAVNFVSHQLVTILLVKDQIRLDQTTQELLTMISRMYEKIRPERTNPRQVRARKVNHFPLVHSRVP